MNPKERKSNALTPASCPRFPFVCIIYSFSRDENVTLCKLLVLAKATLHFISGQLAFFFVLFLFLPSFPLSCYSRVLSAGSFPIVASVPSFFPYLLCFLFLLFLFLFLSFIVSFLLSSYPFFLCSIIFDLEFLHFSKHTCVILQNDTFTNSQTKK